MEGIGTLDSPTSVRLDCIQSADVDGVKMLYGMLNLTKPNTNVRKYTNAHCTVAEDGTKKATLEATEENSEATTPTDIAIAFDATRQKRGFVSNSMKNGFRIQLGTSFAARKPARARKLDVMMEAVKAVHGGRTIREVTRTYELCDRTLANYCKKYTKPTVATTASAATPDDRQTPGGSNDIPDAPTEVAIPLPWATFGYAIKGTCQ
ncbi:hypothetical protein J6590_102206 [Homalodisca vitripennis]|nr:hypothetical protein J6590_102206 [Homalodisca vitripennis]